MTVSSSVSAEKTFPDITYNFAKQEIMYLTERGIIQGYPDGMFKPNENVTRMQAVVMIGRAQSWDLANTIKTFPDVSNDGDDRYINAAYEKSIISGYPNGTFRPNESLTRAQMAVILANAYKFPTIGKRSFSDAREGHWYYDQLQQLATNQIVVGYTDGSFGANDVISRAQFSAMLARVLQESFRPVPTTDIYKKVITEEASVSLKIGKALEDQVIGEIPKDTILPIIESDGLWSIVFYEGNVGYVENEFLQLLPLLGKIIIVDPGHGGEEEGAKGNSLIEKEINLDVSLQVKALLEDKGATVIMTRETDITVSLDERPTFSESYNADIFVSIHTNNFYSNFFGTETYFNNVPWTDGFVNPYPDASFALATSIQTSLVSMIETKDNGVREDSFRVLRKNTVPSALVELAYLSNPDDAEKLKTEEFRKNAAIGIAQGIELYFIK
jgi:N-acetylmuramoyl-L-alanine amidase